MSKTKKRLAILLGSVLIFAHVFGFLLFPSAVHSAGLPVVDVPVLGVLTQREVRTTLSNSLLAAGLGALVQGASYFSRKIAYDTARYVASGGKGQGALAFQKGFDQYLKDTADEAGGALIEEFGKPFGLNLCKPPNIQTSVFLQIGLRSLYDLDVVGPGGPQPPQCSFTEFKSNWQNADYSQYGRDVISQNFSKSLIVSQSDFGVALGAQAKIDNIVLQKKEAAGQERLEGAGFKPLTSAISGRIKTPADVIREETTAVTKKHQGELSATQIAGIYGSGAEAILPMAGQVFLNTLLSEFLNKLLTEGLFPDGGYDVAGGGAGGGPAFSHTAAPLRQGRARAETAFSFFLTAVPTRQQSNFAVVQELASCPENPGLYNCVVDTGFQRLLQIAQNAQEFMTVKEALDDPQGLLHDWPFISPRREEDNQDVSSNGCQTKGYCYSNLQKLRKLRIIPVGWEIAALKADPDHPERWTLRRVMEGFNDCNERGQSDANHPYCHLVDPNWVIKAPAARCEVSGFSDIIHQSSGFRLEQCADVSTCVNEAPDGSCEDDQFRYCTREKNSWNIPGKQCDAQFATCDTYLGSDGSLASYLSRTLNFEECTQDSVGCRAYAFEQSGGEWENSANVNLDLKELGRVGTAYFNQNIAQRGCPSGADGCNAFYEALGQDQKGDLVYLKKAPEHLGCYDIDLETPEIEYPQTEAELALLRDRPEQCGKYASVCTPEEISCERYLPESQSGLPVTGIIGANLCDEQCVGYDAFRQESTSFEQSRFPVYFVPSAAQRCESQYVGCDEFTNLDAGDGTQLAYFTDIDACEQPEEGNSEIYFTWEGSAREGFVLKRHRLLVISDAQREYIEGMPGFGRILKNEMARRDNGGEVIASPAYADDSRQNLALNFLLCNERKYNVLVNNPHSLDAAHPDCRAFTDENGEIFYRLASQVVEVSDQCQRLRKSESNLFVDENIEDPGRCAAVGGVFENNTCQRCAGGGVFENGACVYKALTDTSNSCPVQASGCRSYIGNRGNNLERVYFTSFELPGDDEGENALLSAKEGWSDDERVRPEATVVGGHSLLVTGGDATYSFDEGAIRKNNWYHLTFWAKGDSLSLRTRLENNVSQYNFSENSVSVGRSWKEYQVGPVYFDGVTDRGVQLVFDGPADRSYFIDNVKIELLTDHDFLIKDSWQTEDGFDAPLVCDAFPNDGLPGEALGCRAYTDSLENRVTVTGFEKLCRQEAVGCTALYDTYNTLDTEGVMVYNVWCDSSDDPNQRTCFVTDDEDLAGPAFAQCEVPIGHDGCYIESLELPDDDRSPQQIIEDRLSNLVITSATVIVPADTNLATPVYLTYNDRTECESDFIGCRVVGQESQNITSEDDEAYSFSVQALRVADPSHYNETLCADSELGCGEYRNGNEVSYFKDPRVIGNSVCRYVPPRGEALDQRGGWFQDGAGLCVGGARDGNVCRSDAQCGEGTCDTDIRVPCYPNYLLENSEYGLWSNETGGYDGFVGSCPADQANCTEFIDRADTSRSNPGGAPYYVILNDDLLAAEGCEQGVSLKEGCVLFDRTDVPNKLFDAQATYEASVNKVDDAYGFVDAIDNDIQGTNDSNVLLKVDRDRQCSEWLQCKTQVSRVNRDTGEASKLCYQLQSCRKLGPGGECLEWVDNSLLVDKLTPEKYETRDISWYGDEYVGYSLLNRYDVGNYVNIAFDDDSVFYLAFRLDPQFLKDFPQSSCSETRQTPGGLLRTNHPDFNTRCGFDLGGRCYQGACIYPIGGMFASDVGGQVLPADEVERQNLLQNAKEAVKRSLQDTGSRAECKAYPDKDSPFSFRMALEEGKGGIEKEAPGAARRYEYVNYRLPQYKQVNICNDLTGEGCSCEYRRIEYKSGVVDFWPILASGENIDTMIPRGVCSGIGGESEGNGCEDDGDCGEGGICNYKSRVGQEIGHRGFCLEPDLSRPLGSGKFVCQTWLPVDVSASRLDSSNNDQAAGYSPSIDGRSADAEVAVGDFGQLYCVDSNAHGRFVHDDRNWVSLGDDPRNESYSGYLSERDRMNGADDIISEMSFVHNKADMDQSYIYTYMQWWAWTHPELGSNSLVTEVPPPGRWALYHDKIPQECDGGRSCYSTFVRESHRNEEEALNLFILNNGEVPDIFNARIDHEGTLRTLERALYFDEVQSIRWAPFIVKGGLDKGNLRGAVDDAVDEDFCGVKIGGRCLVQGSHMYATDRVAINIDKLRDGGPGVFELNQMLQNELTNEFFNIKYTFTGSDGLDPNFGQEEMYTFLAERNTDLSPIEDFSDIRAVAGVIVVMDKEEPDFEAQVVPCIQSMLQENTSRFDILNPEGCDFVGAFWQNYVDGQGILIDGFQSSFTNNEQIYFIFEEGDDARTPVSLGRSEHGGWRLDNLSKGEWYIHFPEVPYFTKIVTFGAQCTDYALVNDSSYIVPQSFTFNKAWTNRVWNGGDRQLAISGRENEYSAFNSIQRETTLKPYSSRPIDTEEFLSYLGRNAPPGELIKKSIFINERFSGFPFACQSPLISSLDIYTRDAVTGENPFAGFPRSDVCRGLAGAGYDDQDRQNIPNVRHLRDLGISGEDILEQLFVSYRQSEQQPSGRFSELGRVVDVSGPSADHHRDGIVPQIYAVNPTDCNDDKKFCRPAEVDAFTINRKNYTLSDYDNNGVRDEDNDRNDRPDPLIGRQNFAATLQFYAFADEDRMPIRRVMLDWDDGFVMDQDRVGFSRNHKPYCFTEDDTPRRCSNTQLTCADHDDCAHLTNLGGPSFCEPADLSFGDTAARACDPAYFEYKHEYSCQDGDGNETVTVDELDNDRDHPTLSTLDQGIRLDAQNLLLRMPEVGLNSEVCIFRPKVQVLDNWGWCNGDCLGPGEGCYDDNRPRARGEECRQQCSDDGFSHQHYLPYRGAIFVVK